MKKILTFILGSGRIPHASAVGRLQKLVQIGSLAACLYAE